MGFQQGLDPIDFLG